MVEYQVGENEQPERGPVADDGDNTSAGKAAVPKTSVGLFLGLLVLLQRLVVHDFDGELSARVDVRPKHNLREAALAERAPEDVARLRDIMARDLVHCRGRDAWHA